MTAFLNLSNRPFRNLEKGTEESAAHSTGKPVFSVLFIAFIFLTLRNFFGTAVVELYMRGGMGRREDEQKGEYWFPCARLDSLSNSRVSVKSPPRA